MSVTRAALRQAVAARMMRTVVGVASGGSTVALADPDRLQDAGASDDAWTGAWLHITAGANAGEVRRVTVYDPASGSVTVNRPFAQPIDGTSAYELLRLLSPAELHQAIDDTLTRCWRRTLADLTSVADAQRQFPLPAWVTRRQQVVEVWERRGEHLRAVDWWRLRRRPVASPSPFWLEVGHAPGGALVVEALRPYEALANDQGITDAPADWVVAGALAHAYRRLRRDAPAADVDRYAALQWEAAHEFQRLSRLYQPRAVRRVQLGERL
ncbi:MAG: hypothetical protein OXG43_12685 [Chloroflexi bacterium]|nr:hypothetical protein [Chloroflexota bacterium]